ncbi:MAG: RNA methyltransferase [Hyphomicrobiaceae bacterium]
MRRPQARATRHRPADRPEKGKHRRVAGLAAVTALFRHAPETVARLYLTDGMKGAANPFCLELAQSRKPFRVVGAAELARIAGTPMHGGIVALAEPRPVRPLDLGEAQRWARAGEPILMLDGVGNPHNLGAIARTAAFFGIGRLVLSDHPAQAMPSDASARVAEGGLELIEVYRAHRFAEVLQRLRPHYRIIASALEHGLPIDRIEPDRRPIALVLGNEEDGIAKPTLAAAETIVTIPGAGDVQSLNVAAAAAILIHALCARR